MNKITLYRPQLSLKVEPTPFIQFEPTKMKILAKWCWLVLQKVGAVKPHFGQSEVWTMTRQNEQDLLKAMFIALKDYAQFGDEWKDLAIIVGGNTFTEICRSPQITGVLNLGDVPDRYAFGGVPMTVVPFFDGFIVVPRRILK